MPEDAPGFIDRLYEEISLDPLERETITFIHFTDAHLDLYYQEGAIADCGGSYCCRTESNDGVGQLKAGKWGPPSAAHHCDIPMITLQNALNNIHSLPEYADAYLFWTGDSTAHDDPWVSQTEVADTLQAIINEVSQIFADKIQDTFVSLGNHDWFPNAQEDFESIWPTEEVLNQLKQFVPLNQHGGYFRHNYYYKDVYELGARIISLNTESCDFHNDYLLS